MSPSVDQEPGDHGGRPHEADAAADGDATTLSEVARGALWSRWQAPPGEQMTPRRMELRRLADSMRSMMDLLVATAAPTELITEAADRISEVAEGFEGLAGRSLYEGFSEATLAGGDPHASFEHSPFIGRANPLAPPIELEEVDGQVIGRVVFGSPYEGPPGCVHGGYVAGAFDEVLGATQTLSGQPGMTGTLTVRFRSPTPLHTELRFVCDLVRTEGRKIFTEAKLFAGERLCAEAEGIFVSIDFSVFQALRAERDQARSAPADGDAADPGA